MNKKIMKTNNGVRHGIILLIIFCSIIFSITTASAVDKTYYWDRTTGDSIAGFTTDWSSCSSSAQNGYRVTSLGSSASYCTNGQLSRTNAGDLFLAIFPTAYTSDTQITGKTNARFYLRSNSGSAIYRFDLGYARSGAFTSLGSVTRTGVSTSGTTYTIDLSTISGTAPAGSNLALKVSVTTSGGGRVYMGTNGGTSGSNSGRFYVSETAATPSTPTYNVTITASPASTGTIVGSSSTYNIVVNNTGNSNGNYTLSVTDSDTANFIGSTLGTTTMQINSGSNAATTLTVTARSSATTGAVDGTTVTVRSVENSIYVNSTNVQTTVIATPTPGTNPQIRVKANRYVVLDDPNSGTTASGFFSPADVRGGNWGTNYWSGESTTIRAAAIVMSSGGSKLPGVTVTFKLLNPAGGSPVNTATSITDGEGAAYYSYDLNGKNYWGNWKIDASATVSGSNIANNSSFVLYWWGCGQCHNSESPGNWGTKYTPKSYYTMGYDFHRSQDKSKHTETMAKGNCVTCHQMYNGIPIDRGYNDNTPTINVENEYSPDWHNGKVTCQGCHAGSNISANPQGKNPEIAGCYDTAGCHPKKNTNVGRENSTSGYVVGGTYRSLYSNIPNSTKAHTVTSVRCILCHDAGHAISKPYNVSSSSNTNTENEQCWACHTQRPAHYGTSCTGCHSQDAHNISVSGGGPDCILCHGIGGTALHKVDQNAMAAGEHGNLNSGVTASSVSAANKKCWGCHQSDGNQPTDMGDKYNTPYRCYECHGPTKPYARASGAMTVIEHFKSGSDVKAGIFAIDDSSSCVLCHSVPEMTVTYTDDEFSELSIGSHYGVNRSGTLDCLYCHRNTSTAFNPAMMSNIENNNLSNHSRSPATPVCTTCHGSGMLHNATLTKPASSNSTYCKTCHVDKNEHKTVYCAECHTNNTDRSQAGREIHGIRYLQKDNTFSTVKTNVVDCTTCHQSDVVNSSLRLASPQISNPLHHSDDINNGSKWGNYWVSPIEACLYCHNDTRHNVTPLGRPLIWNSSYVISTIIGSGTNCADCHYKGDTNYNNMKSAFTTASKPIPPEITNGSWNGKPGYYNHTLSNYTDVQCKNCHYKGTGTTVGQMLHNISVGGGGPDCKSCHDVGSVSAPKLVNFSAMNSSSAGHKNLNSGASTTVNAENRKCWACHGDGTQPSGHPSNYRTPTDCTICHTGTRSYGAPLVAEHNQIGQDVQTPVVNCTQCHDNNGMFIPGTGVGTVNHYVKDVTNTATTPYGHLGPIDTSNCLICHKGLYTNNPDWGSPVNITTSIKRQHTETLNSQCDGCHKDGSVTTLANVDFHNATLTAGAGGDNCLGCHAGVE